ncbi:GNAT family N-acetyltransferase [Sabulicella glaciei]|uniref:GNAT family N-acetyltransferase n=1 Tax=Sabulicella glaciei TaxID=2984948 RepID=A0ABT3NRK3_9PROT|nr:GNAT family N-acetyltransferase [Roseococcus sp. MDT2-1-1]MCW8084795.1 GNAT family N-acetyltransferase [Roseococcus sp. MDT2-1-1]
MSSALAAPLSAPARFGTQKLRVVEVEAPFLPCWCDAFLDEEDFFASRLWFDTLLAHARPLGSKLVLAVDEAAGILLPLMRGPGGMSSLSTPYTLDWRPLGPGAAREAGLGLAAARRWDAPLRLDALDPGEPGTAALLQGARDGGLQVLPFRHFGNWRDVLPPGVTWEAWLEGRPGALRTTIRRKATSRVTFEIVDRPGPALEAGIAAFEAVRAASWKPAEPAPALDAALMRTAAPLGILRLGILRRSADGWPIAAQYWLLDAPGGRRRATLPKLHHVEAAREHSPGTVLTARMMEHLLTEDAVREVDFGRGDDPYKKLWVATRRQREGAVLASMRHPAGLLALARATASRLRRSFA